MNKSQLVDELSQDLNLSTNETSGIVGTIMDSMTKALTSGEGIEFRGFGSFSVRIYDGYKGRNPKTGEIVTVKAKKLHFFKAGKDLREAVKGKNN